MTPEEMRADALERVTRARQKLTDTAFTDNERAQVEIVLDGINGLVLNALANALEQINPKIARTRARVMVEEAARHADALRRAAAKGYAKNDWTEFDQLVDASGGDSTGSTVGGESVDPLG